MLLELKRKPSVNGATLGNLSLNGSHLCETLEDEVREVQGIPVSEWKIKGETAIPRGTYKLTLVNSPKFGPNTIAVNGVEGFSNILIHSGNTPEDTEGCILVGLIASIDKILPGTSKPALIIVKKLLQSAIDKKEDCFIKVE